MSTKLKVLVVGPKEAGKTLIANMISDHDSDGSSAKKTYKPTVASRILEFEKDLADNSRSWDTRSAEVELWDVSGDQKYEGCYPAIMDGCDGVILVYDPGNHAHEREIELWYEWFIKNPGLSDDKCLCLAHFKESSRGQDKPNCPRALRKVKLVISDFESAPKIREEFESFLSALDAQKGRSGGGKR